MVNTNEIKKLLIVFSVVFSSVFILQGGTIDLPHKYLRTNPNMLSNSAFNGTSSWDLHSGPVYESSDSHTSDGTGCIKYPTGEDAYCQLISELIYYPNFEYNKPYTISFYAKTLYEPVYFRVALHMYDANDVRTTQSGRGATSTTGEWQEIVCVLRITDPNVVKVKVVIEPCGSTLPSDFLVDEVYMGENLSFAEAPVSSRQTFSGSKTAVDELGNWQVYETTTGGGEWKDFFPFALYPDLVYRTNFQSLSDQGFNTVMSMMFKSRIQWAKNAVSTFNPNGMKAGLRLSNYASGDPVWTLTRLATDINDVNSDLSETLLCYDWDNEDYIEWSHKFDMINTIRNNDVNHPIYILNGHAGVQRIFSKRLSDVCGTYTGFSPLEGMEAGNGSFDLMQYLEKQDIPVSIGHINSVEDTFYGFRLRVYYCLIKGAKGICWWGDGRSGLPLAENCAWWNDIPNLRDEIDQMMPIIKRPHWTTWSVTCSDSNIMFNTREYASDGYMIVMNPTSNSSINTFTINNFYSTEVWNYFDDSFAASVINNQFTVLMPAHSTALYRLVDVNYPENLLNGDMETTGGPLSYWSDYGNGTIIRDTTVKFTGNASGKISNSATTDDTMLLQHYPALKPNTTYRFTAMMKTDNVVKNDINKTSSGAIIQLYTGGGNWFFPTGGLTGTNDWQLVEKEFTTPAEPNTSWYVRLRLWEASGTVWFDNVKLQELHDNILTNGNMETAGGPLSDWSDSGDGTIIMDTTTKYAGLASGKITNSATIDDTMLLQHYPALKPNTTYRFTAMMKTDNVVKNDINKTSSGAIIQLYTGGGNWFFPTGGLTGTNDWQLVEKEFTTPAEPNTSWYVRLRLWEASGTVWFDNVCLYEVE